jgi:hypothetical protein
VTTATVIVINTNSYLSSWEQKEAGLFLAFPGYKIISQNLLGMARGEA